MRKIALCLVFCVCNAFGPHAFAANKFYTVVGIGVADAQIEDVSSTDFSYRLNFGYEFHEQWQTELGYQRFVDDNNEEDSGLAVQALSLSALGKARNRNGELFYRLGIAYVDIEGTIDSVDTDRCNGSGQIQISNASRCTVDEGGVGAIVGMGYDLYVGLHSEVRVEAEYMLGNNNLTAAAMYIGYKLKF